MTKVEIKQSDITALADMLDRLELPEDQQALLSAIVATAAHATRCKRVPGTVTKNAEVTASFHDQFTASFTPGAEPRTGNGANTLMIDIKIGRNG